MHVVASMHPPPSARPMGPPNMPWSDDDQKLLMDLLLSADAANDDVKMQEPVEIVETCPDTVSSPPPKKNSSPKAKGKLTAMERRARHREVVKRAYHRNKAALKSLRDTVKTLEDQLERLSLKTTNSTATTTTKPFAKPDIQQRYALLTTQQEELGQEAARLRLLLNYRQQFAANMVSLAQHAASISSDSESDTDSDTPTVASTITSSPSPSTVSTWSVDSSISLHDTEMDTFSFYKEPHQTMLGPNVSTKAPLAISMQKQIGYKPLALEESSKLVNDVYRSVLTFSLSGRAISSGVHIMGWEDKRLLDGTTLKFSLRKRFPRENALRLMASTWQCLSDPECTETRFRGLMTLRVLQRVNDDTIIALRDTSSEDDTKIYRCVYILFRVRTRNGFLICIQSVDPAQLTDPTLNSITRDGKMVQWVDMSCWFLFEHDSEFEEGGAQIEYGGSMDNGDMESIRNLAINTLSVVLKWESTMVGPFFTLPASS